MQKLIKKLAYLLSKKNPQGFPIRYNEAGKQESVKALNEYNWSDVAEPITRNRLILWIKDLRSGKYTQGTGYLKATVKRDNSGKFCAPTANHCCLGVLADTSGSMSLDEGLFYYRGNSCSLLMVSTTSYHLPASLQRTLASMNDGEGYDFNDIADYLEEIFEIV